MFGYVLPRFDELRLADYKRFRACYCGLCRTLGRQYGPAARMILNYDFTFLAMLLWPEGKKPEYGCAFCPVRPVRGKQVCLDCDDMDAAAACSIILAWWKLRDDQTDEGVWGRLKAASAMAALKRAYRRAAERYPQFDRAAAQRLSELRALEESGCDSLDQVADKFALLLSAAAELAPTEEKRRVASTLLYQLGRWIYLADARNDLVSDVERGQYNVLAARYGAPDGKLSSADDELLRQTMHASRSMAAAAFELWPVSEWSEVLSNTLYLGLDNVAQLVFSGEFRPVKRRRNDEFGESI